MFKASLGLLFIGAGVMALLVFAKKAMLECDRLEPTQIECTLVSEGILGSDTTIIPSGHLQGAEVDVSEDSDGDDTYRVLLRTETGTVPLTTVYSSGRSGKQAKVQQINAYLNNQNQKILTIQQDDRIFGYIFGGVFILVGVVTMGSAITGQ